MALTEQQQRSLLACARLLDTVASYRRSTCKCQTNRRRFRRAQREKLGLGWMRIAPLQIVHMGPAVLVGKWGRQVSASGGIRLSYVAAEAEARPFLNFL